MCLILCCLTSLFFVPRVNAEITDELGEQVATSKDARLIANKYSSDTGGVGIIMSYGVKNAVTPEEIGDAFVKEMASRGVKSRYFYYETDRDGMAMEFYIGYSALGPWNVDDAAANMSKIVARVKAARNVQN